MVLQQLQEEWKWGVTVAAETTCWFRPARHHDVRSDGGKNFGEDRPPHWIIFVAVDISNVFNTRRWGKVLSLDQPPVELLHAHKGLSISTGVTAIAYADDHRFIIEASQKEEAHGRAGCCIVRGWRRNGWRAGGWRCGAGKDGGVDPEIPRKGTSELTECLWWGLHLDNTLSRQSGRLGEKMEALSKVDAKREGFLYIGGREWRLPGVRECRQDGQYTGIRKLVKEVGVCQGKWLAWTRRLVKDLRLWAMDPLVLLPKGLCKTMEDTCSTCRAPDSGRNILSSNVKDGGKRRAAWGGFYGFYSRNWKYNGKDGGRQRSMNCLYDFVVDIMSIKEMKIGGKRRGTFPPLDEG
ncbi:hypothetical protein WA026_005361 [Henosepilachna vigintioctopunctata]|uniref:Uncharacterized protein n=1 Tax=Henosepilachna vigintioctopunctata TaxID=420089 RepID=A0AAW1U2K4_9CUCU